MSKHVDARKNRWREFLRPESDPGWLFICELPREDAQAVFRLLRPNNTAARVDYALREHEKQLRRAEVLHDDLVPHLNVLTGTEIFAEAFGCQVHRPEGNMPCAMPLIHTAEEVKKIKVPRLEDTPLMELFDIADALREKADCDAVLRIPDIQSPMDIAALVWEKSEMLLAMVLEPEAVEELARKAAQLLTAFLDQWFTRYGTEYVAHCPDYFIGNGISVSEDEVGIVSGDMFEQFFRPHLVALSERYHGLGIHCCADARHQWDNFNRLPNLRLLNISRGKHQWREAKEAYGFFNHSIAQMHYGWFPEGPLESCLAQYPPNAKVVMKPTPRTLDEAIEIADKLNVLRGDWQGVPKWPVARL